MTVQEDLDRTMWPVVVFGTMFVAFGVVALVLAGIGLYAVIAFSVTRREREMGIRMALGATALDVLRVIGREGTRQVVIGTVIGLAVGAGIAQLGRAALFEVAPHDPLMYLAVVGTLAIVGVAACVVPALRATRVDPVVVLRAE
jgi:ABC-type antimicrobial peptide transport system permease subunit